jgi:hypothetical protein
MVDFSSLYELDRGQPPKRRGFGWLLALVLPVLALIGFLSYSLLLDSLVVATVYASPSATSTATWTPIPILTATPQYTPVVTTGSIAMLSTPAEGCTDWSQVSLKDLNKNMCVQGDYIQTYQRDDGTWVMVFSNEPGAFQVWSSRKPFDSYLKGSNSHCVRVKGWIMTSGVRPLIILSPSCKLGPCP